MSKKILFIQNLICVISYTVTGTFAKEQENICRALSERKKRYGLTENEQKEYIQLRGIKSKTGMSLGSVTFTNPDRIDLDSVSPSFTLWSESIVQLNDTIAELISDADNKSITLGEYIDRDDLPF